MNHIPAEADEVTYRSHCCPATWNKSSRKWLGIVPTSLGNGCLQDVHWAGASIGYFPTYTIGNLYAAQLAEAYAAQHDLDAELGAGNPRSLRDWLATNVYHWGCRLNAEEIVRKATGRGLDTDAFFRHLAARFP